MVPATSVTGTGHSSPMICWSVTTFAPTAVLELRGLLVPVIRRSSRRGWHSASGPGGDVEQQQEVVEIFCSWRLQGHSHPRIGRRKDVRRSMLLRREKSGCILVGRSGGFERILQDGTAKWKKNATTSTSSPRARSDDRDEDEDPFYVPGIADEPRERRVRRQPSQPLNSSLLECTDLPSFKHRGDGSVRHLGESRRILLDQWRCGVVLLVRRRVQWSL